MLGELVPLGGGDPIPLLKPRLMVGRRDSCDIILSFPNVSSHHTELEFLGGYWQARNLSSSNGTKVNGERIDERFLQPGDTILIHAAAGGVGLLVCQWAKALGATVIGTVGSDEKAAIARAHGCDHPIVYTREKFAERVREITAGEGVPVVYDSIGADTFMDSLSCLRPLGMMVLFGAASGPVAPFDCGLLAKMGSLFLTRPTLFTYIAKRTDLVAMAAELFEVVVSGKVRLEINQRYALKDAAQAHRDLEARKTTGSTILLP